MKTAFVILTLFLFASSSADLLACSCVGERSVENEINHADAVLLGTILSKELEILNDSSSQNASVTRIAVAKYDLLVEGFYKGKIRKDTVRILTGMGGGDCGVRFKIGQRYIVYGEMESYFGQMNNNIEFPKGKNTFWTNHCLRTQEYSQFEIEKIEKYAKKKKVKKDEELPILVNPETPPIYKYGGDAGLKQFIIENLKYPNGLCIEGVVYVQFTVDSSGITKDIEVKRGIGKEADQEAIRIVKLLRFVPGKMNAKPVDTRMTLPIRFTIK